ncbi:MAG: hypothetical protein JO270_26135 [Acidobacteriaceae bacterium]|nr:hypothetical protein [Acidobacteriaceae bacterium]MBV8569699.1 hypothetical protein [Acidobacteriaceae bacterium]
MKQKDADIELLSELRLALVGQDEVWDFPDIVASQNGEDPTSQSLSMEELIEIVLGSNLGGERG